jgi:uncharacterized membrane protein YkvA (DUF1232 family)
MDTWLIVILGVLGGLVGASVLALWLFWSRRRVARDLLERIGALPWRARTQLAGELFRDPRVPLALRLAMPLLVIYLLLPLDLIPDFIPIIGQVDDLIVIALVAGLLLRALPVDVIGEHISELEAEYGEFIEAEGSTPPSKTLGPGRA